MFSAKQVSAVIIPAKVSGQLRILPLGDFQSAGRLSGGNFYLNEHVGKSFADPTKAKAFPTKVTYGNDEEKADSPAAGWFQNLAWFSDGLYITDLQLTKRAQEMVNSREYLYLAPVLYAEGNIPRDLIGLVLTNDPQIRLRNYADLTPRRS